MSMNLKEKKRCQTMTRIDNKLEAFLAGQQDQIIDLYDQDSCVQDHTDRKFLGKFEFKLVLVSRDRVYLCENPPRNLDNFILLDDILEITTVINMKAHKSLKYPNNFKLKGGLFICLTTTK